MTLSILVKIKFHDFSRNSRKFQNSTKYMTFPWPWQPWMKMNNTITLQVHRGVWVIVSLWNLLPSLKCKQCCYQCLGPPPLPFKHDTTIRGQFVTNIYCTLLSVEREKMDFLDIFLPNTCFFFKISRGCAELKTHKLINCVERTCFVTLLRDPSYSVMYSDI